MKYALLTLFSTCLLAQNIVLDSARMAKAAYEEAPKTTFKLLHDHTHRLWGNRLMAFHDLTTDSIYISVRGTSKLQNWLANAHIGAAGKVINSIFNWITQQPEHQQHYDTVKDLTGLWFILAFEDLKDQVTSIVKEYPNTQVIFTGHSYGGIMSNLLAQDAYQRYPNLKFRCHTFSAPGSLEIRENSLKLPQIPAEILSKRFFNHVRITDPIGHANTHEGNVWYYPAAFRKDLLGAHVITYLVEDLEHGMEPIHQQNLL